jgi:phage pi2 protein 07
MIDISSVGTDIGVFDTQTPRAANILSIQQGVLVYVPADFGIDLKFFLDENFRFQNASFKSYLVQILANYSINVSQVADILNDLHRQYTFMIAPAETETSLVAR